MEHKGDGDIPENQRAYERRMKELDAATVDAAATRENVRLRITRRSAIDDADAEASTEAMARALEFLKMKAPPPRSSGNPFDTRRYASDSEIEDWAHFVRYMRPQGAEVLRDVYPAWYASMQIELNGRIGALRENLPFEARVLIGNTFDLRLDGSDDPEVAIVLQRSYARPPPEQPPPRGTVKNREPPTPGQSLGQR
jgi:hypothetical protein